MNVYLNPRGGLFCSGHNGPYFRTPMGGNEHETEGTKSLFFVLFNYLALTCYVRMGIEALCAAPPEAPSLQVGPVAVVGVGHLRIVHHLLV